jgi:hypothetical protein
MADFAATEVLYGSELGADAPAARFVDLPVTRAFEGVAGAPAGVLTLVFIDPIPPNLPSPGRSLLFNVTNVGEVGVSIVAEYNTGAYEVVHDGSEFSQVYAAQSVRTAIVGGFQYLVKRAGGWFGDSVTIRTIAASASGA